MLLALDLSTTCTGYAVFDRENRTLKDYGKIIPEKIQRSKSLKSYATALIKMRSISDQIVELIQEVNPKIIVIEEICKGSSRLGQKTLDGLHYVVLDKLLLEDLKRVTYMDVIDWRGRLGIRLSEQDKLQNKFNRKNNKLAGKRGTKLPIWTYKHKAQQWVNRKFKLNFDVIKNPTDADICDAICVGYAYLESVK
jgi:hypothetical protein